MSDPLDLDAYCRRAGYDGPRTATLATLRTLHALHPAAIPFENLDSRFGVAPALDMASLQAKLVGRRRGGYCFEQNTLFEGVLQAMGFSVRALMARVRWGRGEDVPPTARSHKLLAVTLDGEDWLADVGFGGCLLTAPLRMDETGSQETPHEPARLVRRSDGLIEQQRLLAGAWAPTYRFTLETAYPIDFEVSNWFVATHPGSMFTNTLIAERVTPGRRVALTNGVLTVREAGHEAYKRTLRSGAELDAVLRTDFGLDPPSNADLEAVVGMSA